MWLRPSKEDNVTQNRKWKECDSDNVITIIWPGQENEVVTQTKNLGECGSDKDTTLI